jgi:hypothetical protein
VAKRFPLVSVLVPTYNGAAYLDQTLSSIVGQTYRQLEIIVRDDGSSDNTLEIIDRFAIEDRRIRVVSGEENVGAHGNFVALAGLATGKFVKFCNQDDLIDPTHVEVLMQPMMRDPNISMCTSSRRMIDGAGHELPPRAWTVPLVEKNRVLTGISLASRTLLTGINQIGEPTTPLFRNGLIPPDEIFRYGGKEFSVNGEIALWLKLLAVGNIYVNAEPLSSFRMHDGQRSASLRVHITGALEWVEFLAGGLSSGVVKPGAAAELAARNVVGALTTAIGMLSQSDEAGLYHWIEPLSDAIGRAWRMGQGDVAALNATLDAEARVA